jgi:hypothetical protein
VLHCTPEQLALAALREPLPPADAEHLSGCDRCRQEVASLRRGVDALAVPQLAAPSSSVAPPPAVWAAIAARTGVTTQPRPEAPGRFPTEIPTADDDVPAAPPAEVVRLRPRRSRLLVAAAALLVGAGIGAGAVAWSGAGVGDDGSSVAGATLDPLAGSDASGTATVLDRNGARVLRVSLRAPAPGSGYYEVWLAEPDLQHMVAVGVVHGGTAELELPDALDVASYSFVDVSLEPLDGDPAHSTDSVARGRLSG